MTKWRYWLIFLLVVVTGGVWVVFSVRRAKQENKAEVTVENGSGLSGKWLELEKIESITPSSVLPGEETKEVVYEELVMDSRYERMEKRNNELWLVVVLPPLWRGLPLAAVIAPHPARPTKLTPLTERTQAPICLPALWPVPRCGRSPDRATPATPHKTPSPTN